MPSLRELQLRFVAALYERTDAVVAEHIVDDGLTATHRLAIYRNNLRALSRLVLSGQLLRGAKRRLPVLAPPRPSARR